MSPTRSTTSCYWIYIITIDMIVLVVIKTLTIQCGRHKNISWKWNLTTCNIQGRHLLIHPVLGMNVELSSLHSEYREVVVTIFQWHAGRVCKVSRTSMMNNEVQFDVKNITTTAGCISSCDNDKLRNVV